MILSEWSTCLSSGSPQTGGEGGGMGAITCVFSQGRLQGDQDEIAACTFESNSHSVDEGEALLSSSFDALYQCIM